MNETILPIITVQPDIQQVIQDVYDGLVPTDTFWVSCYKTGESSVHAKVQVELDDVDRNLVTFSAVDGDVQFVQSDRGYAVACERLNIPLTPVLLPIQEYKTSEHTRPQKITAFDVSPDGSRYAIGYLDGSISIFPSSTTSKRKLISKPHHSTITSLKFFPSSRVLLSSGSDFSISIISAEFPSPSPNPNTSTPPPSSSTTTTKVNPVRLLRSHTRPITSTSIIGIGRNILSASLDGSIKLWDVSVGEVVDIIRDGTGIGGGVMCICLGKGLGLDEGRRNVKEEGEDKEKEDENQSQSQSQSQSQFVYTGLQNGQIEIFDLNLKKSVYVSKPKSKSKEGKVQINAIANTYINFGDEKTEGEGIVNVGVGGGGGGGVGLLVTGDDEGVIRIYDVDKFFSSSIETSTETSTETGTGTGTGDGNGSGDLDDQVELGLITSFKRNNAAITAIDFIPSTSMELHSNSSNEGENKLIGSGLGLGLAIATKDGLPYVAWISFGRRRTGEEDEMEMKVGVYKEFLGIDCDSIPSICVRSPSSTLESGSGSEGSGTKDIERKEIREGKEVWLISDDEIVRKYRL